MLQKTKTKNKQIKTLFFKHMSSPLFGNIKHFFRQNFVYIIYTYILWFIGNYKTQLLGDIFISKCLATKFFNLLLISNKLE